MTTSPAVLARLASALRPDDDAAPAARFDVADVVSVTPFRVNYRGSLIDYPLRMRAYNKAVVGDHVIVLVQGTSLLVLDRVWRESDDPIPPPIPPDPPPTPVLITKDYAATWAGSYRTNGAYNDNGHLFYGFDVYFKQPFYSAWAYNFAAIQADVGAAANLHSAHVHLRNLYTYRGVGTQDVRLGYHNVRTGVRPNTWAEVTPRAGNVHQWAWPVPPSAQEAWVDVTSSVSNLAGFAGLTIDQSAQGNAYTTFGYLAGPVDTQAPIDPTLRVSYWSH